MAAGVKILSAFTPEAVRWIESLSRKLGKKYTSAIPTDPEYLAGEMGEKLINLNREAPQMLDIYGDEGLYRVLQEANLGESDLGLVKPSTFREAAAPIDTRDPWIRDMVNEKVRNLIDLRESGIGYDDVPFLNIDKDGNLVRVVGHEGRHRSRALEAMGEPHQLVRFRRSDAPLPDLPPQTKLHSQTDIWRGYFPPKPVGTLEELIKFLSVAPPAALGALSQLPEEADVK
jgi:hypothetical protein